MSNQTFVEPKSFMRVCDIPDASLFTTLFVLFGKHFFVGLVNRIGPPWCIRLRDRLRSPHVQR